MRYVIRSKSGMSFETTEIGKVGEETYESVEAAGKALEQVQILYQQEEFYITTIEKNKRKEYKKM